MRSITKCKYTSWLFDYEKYDIAWAWLGVFMFGSIGIALLYKALFG